MEERRLLGDLPEQRRPLLTMRERKGLTQWLHGRIKKTKHKETFDMTQVCAPPVLSLLVLGLLVASRHLGFVACFSGRADFDGRVLKRGGRDGHFGTALRDETKYKTFFCFSSINIELGL